MEAWMMGTVLAPWTDGSITPDALALRMLVACLCGWLLGWCYSRTHGALSYSQNFTQSLVLLAMIVAVVMGVVGDSLSRAFGLAAALAVVRFRTPVKDARDTTFLFMAVAAGMAAGAGQLLYAGMATVLLVLVAFFLGATAFGSRVDAEGILRFRYHGEEGDRSKLTDVIERHASFFQLTGARSAGPGEPEELVYDIDLRNDEASGALVRELANLENVTAVTLLPSARVGEG